MSILIHRNGLFYEFWWLFDLVCPFLVRVMKVFPHLRFHLSQIALCDSNMTVFNGFSSAFFLHDVRQPKAKNIMQLECYYIAYSDELFPPIIPFFPAVLIGHRTHPCSRSCVQAACKSVLHTHAQMLTQALILCIIYQHEPTVSISTESYNTHTHTHISSGMRASSVWPVLMTVTHSTNVLLRVCDGFGDSGPNVSACLQGTDTKTKSV